MIRLNPFALYKLGNVLEPLRAVAEGTDPYNYFGELFRARGQLRTVLESAEFSLGTSRPAAEALENAMKTVLTRLFADMRRGTPAEGESAPPAEPLTWSEANAITNAIRDFEPVLAAELQEKPTYHVQKKGIFHTPDLIERADCIFSTTLVIPETARAEIKAAGRCLAFELWTATGFHIFRGTETLIVEYYDALTGGQKPLKESDRNWGKYIKLLVEEGADQKITDYLQYLKDNHRNPITHPDITLDADAAIALFLAAPNAIVPLAKAIASKTGMLVPAIQAPPSP